MQSERVMAIERLRKTKGVLTQDDLDREIDRLIDLELKAEARRDKQPFESAEYWRLHDLAMSYRERASLLMP